MMKTVTFLSLAVILSSTILAPLSNSAPASSTGAPGEVDCTTSGCHSEFTVNSGPGSVSLSMENGATTYIPGKTYAITCEVNQSYLNRFGYEFLALKDKDSVNAGTLTVTEGGRTQIISGFGDFSERKYMTYTYAGTAAFSTGIGKWTFNWTAPLADEGPVTFYLATIAANDDGTDLGDYCYRKTYTLLPSATAGIDKKSNSDEIKIFPNPVSDKICISWSLPEETRVEIGLFDLNGKKVMDLFSSTQRPGKYSRIFSSENISEGIYLVKIARNNQTTVEKIVVSR